jgi:hypothetical protein
MSGEKIKKAMKKRNVILSLLLVFPLLAGCIKDDYRGCLYITFAAMNPKHVYVDEVERVSIYFYGLQDGALVREYHFERDQLRKNDRAAIIADAPIGTYRVLAIINDGIYSVTERYQNYATAYTEVVSEVLDYNAESHFSAVKEITVEADPEASQVEYMQLIKHNNNVFLHIEYDEEDPYIPTEGTNLIAWIEGSNRRHFYREQYDLYTYNGNSPLNSNHWNRIDNHENQTEEHYLPVHPARFDFTTMRLWHGSDVTLYLAETSESAGGSTRAGEPVRITELDIDDYLKLIMNEATGEQKYGSDIDLEYHDEYHITIQLMADEVVYPDPVSPENTPLIIKKWDYVSGNIHVR